MECRFIRGNSKNSVFSVGKLRQNTFSICKISPPYPFLMIGNTICWNISVAPKYARCSPLTNEQSDFKSKFEILLALRLYLFFIQNVNVWKIHGKGNLHKFTDYPQCGFHTNTHTQSSWRVDWLHATFISASFPLTFNPSAPVHLTHHQPVYSRCFLFVSLIITFGSNALKLSAIVGKQVLFVLSPPPM